MIIALLYQIKVRYLTKKKVEITLVPNWLGRRLRRSLRIGIATRARNTANDLRWWWQATDRCVGEYIEGYIEAAPVMSIEDMPIELLLKEGTDD